MNHLPCDLLIEISNRADNLKGVVCINKEMHTASLQTDTYLKRKAFYKKTMDLFNHFLRKHIFSTRPLCVVDLRDATVDKTISRQIKADYHDSLYESPVEYLQHIFADDGNHKNSNLLPYQLALKSYATGYGLSMRDNYLTLVHENKSYYISIDESSSVTILYKAHYDDAHETIPIFDKESMYLVWGLMLLSKQLYKHSQWTDCSMIVYSYEGSREGVFDELLTLREEIDKASHYVRFGSVKLRYTLMRCWLVQDSQVEILALENKIQALLIQMQILKSSGMIPIVIESV